MSKTEISIIHTDGRTEKQALERKPTLEELQNRVAGCIAVVPGFTVLDGRRVVAYCDEEGQLKRLHINLAATTIWHEQIGHPRECLVGPVVVVTRW
jgi:Domain of unknown function (DUF3846)